LDFVPYIPDSPGERIKFIILVNFKGILI